MRPTHHPFPPPRRRPSRIFLILIFAALPETSAGQPLRPNILWIWADNLAYGDLGCYGNPRIKTPNIDRFAESGARFTQYYIAHPVCSPSRAALLTGRQPFRVGIVDVLRPDGPSGIPADELTLAEALKRTGYNTCAVGKWHLGDRLEFLPLQHGFDRFFGLPYSMDMLPTLLYQDNEIVDRLEGDKVQTITERLTDAAIQYIEESREQPFFLYFSHTLPHPPINLPQDHRRGDRPVYFDAIENLDFETGRLIDAVNRLGLSKETLIVFTSDNGPMASDGDTGGLRGRIRDAYEGGLRVPFIASWPGRIPSASIVETPSIAYDIFPTFVKLAGAKARGNLVYDGQDIWPLLSQEGEFHRQSPFYWVYLDRVTAMREGDWKLHVGARNRTLEKPELYDLDKDPAESRNLSDREPNQVSRLLANVEEFQKQVPKVWSLQYPVRDPKKRPSGVRTE